MNSRLRWKCGFSMLEILVALVFVSFAFLPIYNMFRFGTRGVVSNAREIEETNYASDLINFMRDRKASELDPIVSGTIGKLKTFNNDKEIMEFLNKMSNPPGSKPAIPPIESKEYTRSMSITRYKATSTKLIGKILDGLKKRGEVANYLVSVRVAHVRAGSVNADDEVVLYTIVLD